MNNAFLTVILFLFHVFSNNILLKIDFIFITVLDSRRKFRAEWRDFWNVLFYSAWSSPHQRGMFVSNDELTILCCPSKQNLKDFSLLTHHGCCQCSTYLSFWSLSVWHQRYYFLVCTVGLIVLLGPKYFITWYCYYLIAQKVLLARNTLCKRTYIFCMLTFYVCVNISQMLLHGISSNSAVNVYPSRNTCLNNSEIPSVVA